MQMSSVTAVAAAATKLFNRAVALRRQLHQTPETAWQEKKTARKLRHWLKHYGISHRSIAGTGIMAEIKSGKGRVIALRTDMDALPITEETDYPFKSTQPGRMHACGHDIHMAVVCTCATILKQLQGEYRGTVKFFFQPAEEVPPGGARELIRAGVMNNPQVEMILGLHVNADIKIGRIGVRDGTLMAGALDFDIEIEGKGGHGALPHKTDDPLLCAATLVQKLQTIVPRNIDPFEPAVVSIGKIEGGSARNIIPPACKLLGTARAMNTKTLRQLHRRIMKIVTTTAKGFNCRSRVTFLDGYPPLINDSRANKLIVAAAKESLGDRAIEYLANPYLGGEDFARYLEHATGAMFHLGIGNKKIGAVYGWHHPRFKADEKAIDIGARVLTNAAIGFLNG